MAVSGKRRARDAKKRRRQARERAEQKKKETRHYHNYWSKPTDFIADLESFMKMIELDYVPLQEHQKEMHLSLMLPEGAVGANVYDHHNTKHTLQIVDDMETQTVTASTPVPENIEMGIDLSPPDSQSWTVVQQMLGKFVDLGMTDDSGISMWYSSPLEKFPEKAVPVYENDREDVMLPECDRNDPRGLLHVEL